MKKALRPRVYTSRDVAADPTKPEDGYLQKVVKYIPIEIVTGYVAMVDAVKQNETNKLILYIFLFLLALCPLYTWFFTQEANKPKPVFQTAVSPVAFTAWVFALGGPFATWKETLDQPGIGTIVLVGTVLLIPLAERIFLPPPPHAGN